MCASTEVNDKAIAALFPFIYCLCMVPMYMMHNSKSLLYHQSFIEKCSLMHKKGAENHLKYLKGWKSLVFIEEAT